MYTVVKGVRLRAKSHDPLHVDEKGCQNENGELHHLSRRRPLLHAKRVLWHPHVKGKGK